MRRGLAAILAVLMLGIQTIGPAGGRPFHPAPELVSVPNGIVDARILRRLLAGAAMSAAGGTTTLALVVAIEKKFSKRVDRCDAKRKIDKYDRCVSDALDSFARDLKQPKVKLPEQLKNAPAVIGKAATQVRLAHVGTKPSQPPQQRPAKPKPDARAAEEDKASRERIVEKARSAVAIAAAEIRKDIKLLEATEETAEETAEERDAQVRTGDVIAASLERLDGKLLEATEI